MATYPTDLKLGYGSRRIPRTGRVHDEDGDGLVRTRKLHADRYDFDIVHIALDATAFSTFQAFHDARSADAAAFDFYWRDGVPYPVTFDEPPFEEEQVGPGLTTVRVRLKASV